MGAGHLIRAGQAEDTTRKLRELTGGAGVDFVIETTGRAEVAGATFHGLSMGGTQVQVGDSGVGEFSVPVRSPLSGVLHRHPVDVRKADTTPSRGRVSLSISGLSVPPLQLGAFLQGLRTVRGCVEGNCDPASFIPQLVKLHQAGEFALEPMVAKYAFTDFAQAQQDMHSGKVVKPVLVYGEL